MRNTLLLSVSGTCAARIEPVAEFAAAMDQRGVRISWLVAPRMKQGYRLADDPIAQQWLRRRRDGGDAILLHGFDEAATRRRRAEFARLPQHEARLRLIGADRIMEQTGLRTRLFAPPQWIASKGTLAALPQAGFRTAALLTGIHDLTTGTITPSRVYGIGGGFRSEPWFCRALVLNTERIARRHGIVRLTVTAKQLDRPGPRQAILDAVDLSLHHGLVSATYAPQSRPVSPAA